jgi:xanthine/uracil permease
MQKPLQINNFQLDGIGVATFGSIILYQLLQGYSGFFKYGRSMIRRAIESCRQRSRS